jgi:hypothetical protein
MNHNRIQTTQFKSVPENWYFPIEIFVELEKLVDYTTWLPVHKYMLYWVRYEVKPNKEAELRPTIAGHAGFHLTIWDLCRRNVTSTE